MNFKCVDNVIYRYIRFVCDIFLLSVLLVIPGHSAESCHGSDTTADNVSLWSGETEADEGLEVSQQMMDNLLHGAGTQLENEELLMGISRRLQTALEKMLMAINDTTNQVQALLVKWPGINVPLDTCLTVYGTFCSLGNSYSV